MNQQFKPGRPKVYAVWPPKFSHLSAEEISQPQKIVDDFFKQYSREIFHDCIGHCSCVTPSQEGAISDCSSFFGNLEKLLEAVSVMRQNGSLKGVNEHDPAVLSSEGLANEEAYFRKRYGIAKPVFDKERFYLDLLTDNPIPVLSRIFQSSMDDSLKQKVKKWQMAAICVEYFEYQEGEALINLLIFCEALQKLIEALYVICAAWCWYTQSDEPLLLNGEYIFLSKKEQANPYRVINEFKQRFPYRHVRAEAWDLMHALSHYQREEPGPSISFMENFELLLCMIKAPYFINEESHLMSLIPGIPVKNEPNH